ncbi:MAG: hypothetical protein ACHQWU_10735 [Gemmatimonadales bacterium]
MYSTCIHCHAPLGANEAIELCPIGRRLAFDAHRGRLWIVCARCREWNLTPIEERWEAIEDCERRFRGTTLRASTDNVGLARLSDGTELLRIGEPLKPEMAGWRYGAQFRRRRRAAVASIVGYTAPLYAVNILFDAQMLSVGLSAFGVVLGVGAIVYRIRSRWHPRVALADGRVIQLTINDIMNVQLEPTEDAWSLRWRRRDAPANLTGATAERALRSILATVNDRGGRDDQIRGSLEVLDRSGGRDRYITGLARAWHANGAVGIHELSPDLRLALEMALHEETERRAMEGELATLEAEWRLAEEIAAIADNLFAPRNPTESPAAVSSERGST